MKITKAEPVAGYRLNVEYDDGARGVVDFSDYAGVGDFAAWLKPGSYEQVAITSEGALAWPGDLDLCPDAVYMRLTGKTPEDLFPLLRYQPAYA